MAACMHDARIDRFKVYLIFFFNRQGIDIRTESGRMFLSAIDPCISASHMPKITEWNPIFFQKLFNPGGSSRLPVALFRICMNLTPQFSDLRQ